MPTSKIGVHHSGPMSPSDPLSSSKGLTEASINNAHRDRDFNLSKMGFYIGYNLVIYPDGTRKQYRLLGEQTAAATGSNFDTFHICLIGNFTKGVDTPTTQQLATLRFVLISLIENKPEGAGIKVVPGQSYSFSAFNIFPHRILQPNHTSCYGPALDDNWARNIAMEYLKQKWNSDLLIYRMICAMSDFFNKKKFGRISLGSDGHSDCGITYNP